MDCNIADRGEVTAEQSNSNAKTKKQRRRRIRRLVNTEESEKLKNTRRIKCKHILISTALIILTIGLFTQNFTKINIVQDFLKNYRNQYFEIAHGKSNYCDEKQHLDISSIFARITQNKILHQGQALLQIETALRTDSDLKVMALVGSVGVGKTLFIRAFQQNFPWLENVNIYSWNSYVNNEANKFNLIKILIKNLSECGVNLLVIENMQVRDHGAVAIINEMLTESNQMQRKRIVLIYVFTLNTMLTAEAYELQHEMLRSLPNCNVIYFKSFSELELIDCIKREAEIENVALTRKDYDEIAEIINPFKSGCKNVNAKVLMHGANKTKSYV